MNKYTMHSTQVNTVAYNYMCDMLTSEVLIYVNCENVHIVKLFVVIRNLNTINYTFST